MFRRLIHLFSRKNTQLTEEIVPAGTPWTAYWQTLFSYIPQPTIDYIVSHSGKSIWDVYEEMLSDPRIESVWGSRLSAITKRDYSIVAENNVRDDIVEFVRTAINNINRFTKALESLLYAIAQGYSVVEIIWEVSEGYILPIEIKERYPDWFVLDGNGKLYIRETYGSLKDAPPYKFIVHTHRGRFGDPRGEPVLVKCYWAWYVKKHALQFWALFVEKFGYPPIYAPIEAGISQTTISNILNSLDRLRSGGVATFPAQTKPETFRIPPAHKEIFESLIRFCNQEITTAFLGQTLTTEVGQKGSYAAAKVHLEVREDIAERDVTALEDTLNTTLIPWIVDLNFGPQKKYPEIRFRREANIDLQAVKTAWEMGTPIPTEEVYSIIGIRKPEINEDVLPPPL